MPPPPGRRRVVTLSWVAMAQPSGTWTVNQPWGSVSTGMARLLYDLAGPRAGQRAVAHDRLAPYEDVADADRKLHRILEGRPVRDRVGVEDHDVRPLPAAQLADAPEGKGARRLRRHLAHRFLQRHHAAVARVAAEDP